MRKPRRRNCILDDIAPIANCILGEIAIAIGAISIGEIAIAISPISIARSRSRSREASIDTSREIGEIVIAISLISMIAIDADRRSSGDRRDRDRGASVWVVPAQ